MQFPDEKVKILTRDTYLAMIRNSVGTKMFRNAFAQSKGKRVDIFENGNLSCAIFVSTILALTELLPRTYTHVWKTEQEMKRVGWKNITQPKIGAVLVWEEKLGGSGNGHRHIGFYIGKDKAISNDPKRGYPVVHHWTFGTSKGSPRRMVEKIYWHQSLTR